MVPVCPDSVVADLLNAIVTTSELAVGAGSAGGESGASVVTGTAWYPPEEDAGVSDDFPVNHCQNF